MRAVEGEEGEGKVWHDIQRPQAGAVGLIARAAQDLPAIMPRVLLQDAHNLRYAEA
jgi:hypothetical protein